MTNDDAGQGSSLTEDDRDVTHGSKIDNKDG